MFIFRRLNDIGRELKYGVFVLKPEEYFSMFIMYWGLNTHVRTTICILKCKASVKSLFSFIIEIVTDKYWGRCGRNRMVVGFTTTYAISAYHHESCEFGTCSWRGVLDTTLCDKVFQLLAAGWWFSNDTLVSSTNKTNCHDIAEILLKVTLNTKP